MTASPEQLKALLLGMRIPATSRVVAGPGTDDCGVIRLPSDLLVITTDFVNAWPAMLHLHVGDFYDYGRLVAIANFSDLLGSGATPLGMTLALALPPELSNPDVYTDIIRGVTAVCDEVGAVLLGGDTKGAAHLSCAATAIGTARSGEQLRLCSGLQPGHAIAVSGSVGTFNMSVLEAAAQSPFYAAHRHQLDDAIAARLLLPCALAHELSRENIGAGGTDISDGLGADLIKICNASGKAVRIFAESIPVHPLTRACADQRKIPPWSYAFAGGGDWQFLFGASESDIRALANPAWIIGEVLHDGRESLLSVDGVDHRLPSFGHSDFAYPDFVSEIASTLVGLLQTLRLPGCDFLDRLQDANARKHVHPGSGP